VSLDLGRARRPIRWLRRRPIEALAWLAAIVLSVWVLGAPLWSARYPMMTDLPFHAATASIIRHYFDADFHFREQFAPQFLAVPYLTFYLVAAAAMFVVDAVVAIKVAAAVMLSLLPIGLAVLGRAFGKTPLVGVAGLAMVWCGLTTWGFINHVAALGLFALCTGLSVMQLRRPRRRMAVGLFIALVALLFTHPYRYPFGVCAAVGAAVVMYPSLRRWRPLRWPVVCSLVVFAAWWLVRPSAIRMNVSEPFAFHPERWEEAAALVFNSVPGPDEAVAAERLFRALIAGTGVLGLLWGFPRRHQVFSRRQAAWLVGRQTLVAGCVAAMVLMYFVLPMSLGNWWYVWPREITAAAYISLAFLPGPPSGGISKLAFVLWIAFIVVPMTQLHVDKHRQFDEATKDFTAIVEQLPDAPKLMYLVLHHEDAPTQRTPWVHLPAYVQALRGGWLSFHFANFGAAPMRYRYGEPGALVPPRVPDRWEWTPEVFDVLEHGPFFEWFLVRAPISPEGLMRADPSVRLVAREGTWWLFHRESPLKRFVH
jgi:hypothetical protein